MLQFSVLMSVYSKEVPTFLESSLKSIIEQTLKPSQIVIVKDGPLSKELDNVITNYEREYDDLFKIVNLRSNVGLGKALNIGLGECDHELIVRMDSDDICVMDRFEKQIKYMSENEQISVLGSWIAEFENNPQDIISIRSVPSNHEQIRKLAKKKNPINHMSVVFRKNDVVNAGNYQSFLWNEDYYLWVRMIKKNYIFANLPEALLYVRAGEEMFKRRGGTKYLFSEIKLQKEFVQMKFINRFQAVINILKRVLIRLLPSKIRGFIYKRYLRISPNN